jgi:hypothetical protein
MDAAIFCSFVRWLGTQPVTVAHRPRRPRGEVTQLLVNANWWIGGWLDRMLPRLEVAVAATSPLYSTSERRAA